MTAATIALVACLIIGILSMVALRNSYSSLESLRHLTLEGACVFVGASSVMLLLIFAVLLRRSCFYKADKEEKRFEKPTNPLPVKTSIEIFSSKRPRVEVIHIPSEDEIKYPNEFQSIIELLKIYTGFDFNHFKNYFRRQTDLDEKTFLKLLKQAKNL